MARFKAVEGDQGNNKLHTPTDLDQKGVRAVAAQLNGLVADVVALYIKTKNFHWHVSGPHFRDYHLMFDEQSTEILATLDELGERVRKIGANTLRSIGQIDDMTRVEDNNEEFVDANDMLSELMQDNKAFIRHMREAHVVASQHDDSATTSLLETFIDAAEKRNWFLFEASRTADRSGH